MSVIDDYLQHIAGPERTELERIRKVVHAAVPDAKEVITYGMPGFKYKGKYLVAFAALKSHLSLFPTSGPIDSLKDKLQDYSLSRGTIRFTLENPLPEALIKEILQKRLDDIAEG